MAKPIDGRDCGIWLHRLSIAFGSGLRMTTAIGFLFAAGLCFGGLSGDSSGHARMLALLEKIRERAPEDHPNLSDKRARHWREQVEALRPDAPDVIKWELYLKLGEAEQTVGRDEEAIRHLENAYALLPSIGGELAPGWANRLRFRLGLSYMRLGEAQHRRLHPTPEGSLLPIQGGGVHVDRAPTKKAIEYFTEQLAHHEKDSAPYIAGRWLLNLAYMAAGGDPNRLELAGLDFPGLPITSAELYRRLKQRGVLIVPGHYFFPGYRESWSHRDECLRLNYSQADEVVERGIAILGDEVRAALR